MSKAEDRYLEHFQDGRLRNCSMKANEAPEKLYYAPYGDIREDYPITDNDIEYTRTDAFIEKACEFMCNNIDKQLTIYHNNT